ncbi:MAG: hypothetical protein CMF69_05025 [Magnetovibrio sp.]|nr:hypothetical protein [Magnetovibrio sp.]|tara:strand:- start:2081 stop:2551 length:471 start_codon:yes stop_codon:yes gene_type:complete
MSLTRIPFSFFTALLLTCGCENVENKTVPETTITATTPETIKANKSLATLPTKNMRKQKSPRKEFLPLNVFKQRSIKSLISLTASEILSLLGAPQFKRVDAPAQIWRYHNNECILYLFLYPSSNSLTVAHLETLSRNHKHIPQKKCFSQILLATEK